MLWLLAPVAMPDDPSDMIATIRAEDAFDAGPRLGEIRVPTLVIGGDRDRFYSPALFHETAEGVPDGHLRLYAGRGHGRTLTDRRLGPDVLGFLGER
jgi:pimeloyl-ACP methyl ester carboxylesterase